MALDRQSIMRTDFPSNRRGYDPAAVDAHLDRIADEVQELRRQAAVPAPLSAQAGDQVKAIVEAAERGAQEIRDAAHADARRHVARVTARSSSSICARAPSACAATSTGCRRARTR